MYFLGYEAELAIKNNIYTYFPTLREHSALINKCEGAKDTFVESKGEKNVVQESTASCHS